ncbi:hypothetical protein RJ640_000883 [Escallonia rubra]|uniref:Uncharacterized protein n=1 Tax=Escallonia rubra TaxID=112253 RepID=A0AA88U7R9_9ASTE|nr:hypothetical protein RJ640_000883 [Escallonia rubra]
MVLTVCKISQIDPSVVNMPQFRGKTAISCPKQSHPLSVSLNAPNPRPSSRPTSITTSLHHYGSCPYTATTTGQGEAKLNSKNATSINAIPHTLGRTSSSRKEEEYSLQHRIMDSNDPSYNIPNGSGNSGDAPRKPKRSYGVLISDESLQSRGFTLRRTIEDLNLDHLNTVFVVVGFPRRDTDKIRLALENTDTLMWYEYEKTKRPVAFARATGDGVFNAIIWDVVVDPNRPSHNAICCAFSFIAYHLTT